MSGNLKKVFMFIRLSILLLLSRPFESRKKTKTKTKQNKTNMMKLTVIYLFKKKSFQLRFKKINIRTSSNFKGELVP